MIDTRELKLGNCVYVEISGVRQRIEMVNLITPSGISYEGYMRETGNPNHPYESKIVSADKIFPIPITEKLLKDLGLSRIKDNGEIKYSFKSKNMTYYLVKDEEDFYIAIASEQKSMRITQKGVAYFHELQNAYYSVYKEYFPFRLK